MTKINFHYQFKFHLKNILEETPLIDKRQTINTAPETAIFLGVVLNFMCQVEKYILF